MVNRTIDVLSHIDRKEIQEIGKAINDAFLLANEHAQKAIVHYLEVGKLLHDARKFWPGDKEYGQWRAENTSLSQSWANKLTAVWDTYGDSPPKEIPISTLAELTYLPVAKRKELEQQADDPEQKTPSVRDVKKVAKEERQKEKEDTMPRAMKERLAKEKETKAEEADGIAEIAQTFVGMEFPGRIAYWKDSNKSVDDAYILFGLPPYFDGEPNIDTIILLATALWNEHKSAFTNQAYEIIKESLK